MPSLEFKGKAFVYSHHLSVPFRELTAEPQKSHPKSGQTPGTDGNLIIHGDNLEALKALLPVYAGKVNCIYIDPPYNTGNEGWCYNDNVRSPLMREWLKKSANPVEKEDLERHDKWLCMMWPRLQLLRELLADDGAIFVSIDDNEVHRLRGMMDEIFGEECFVASIVWQKRTSPEARKRLGPAHDTIHVYGKSAAGLALAKLARTDEQNGDFANPDNDPRGPWTSTDLTAQNLDPSKRKDQQYSITLPSGEKIKAPPGRCWSMLEGEFLRLKNDGRIWFGAKGDARPRIKTYLDESEGVSSWTWWPNSEVGHNQEAKKEILEILGPDNPFDYPKPTRLIKRILELITNKDSIVLDSFAGSATTAHAVLAENAKDGGNRRFILVEMEDYADKLTAERVRRVIDGYAFTGTQRTELLREKLNVTRLRNAAALVEKAESIAALEGSHYDTVKMTVEDGALVVTGERQVKETAPGLGSSFTFCTLGAPMTLDALLADGLPSFEALAKYVFFTATGRTLSSLPPKKARAEGYIGESDLYRVHLLYEADKAWLASDAAALTEAQAERIAAQNKERKTALIFAAAKFLSQRELTRHGLTFCQLPYAIHRLLGD
jgi:adenine-specific DNA-methyltransferase